MKTPAVAADILLFFDWADAIEDAVRAKVRGFIEAMLEKELAGAETPALWTTQAERPRRTDARRWLSPWSSQTNADRDIRKTEILFRAPASRTRAARRANGKANRFVPISVAPGPPTP